MSLVEWDAILDSRYYYQPELEQFQPDQLQPRLVITSPIRSLFHLSSLGWIIPYLFGKRYPETPHLHRLDSLVWPSFTHPSVIFYFFLLHFFRALFLLFFWPTCQLSSRPRRWSMISLSVRATHNSKVLFVLLVSSSQVLTFSFGSPLYFNRSCFIF